MELACTSVESIEDQGRRQDVEWIRKRPPVTHELHSVSLEAGLFGLRPSTVVSWRIR